MRKDKGLIGMVAEKCVLCGRSEADERKSDHLRHVWVNRQGQMEEGYFKPRLALTVDEMWLIPKGRSVPICSNRRACTARRSQKIFERGDA